MTERGKTWTEAYRKQCEIRWILTLSKPQRAVFYARVAKARGEPAARVLVRDVSAEWARRHRP